ncbi:hypothetical protein [Roseateles sp.]|uniref:hypothetical protein n=1 Tax=Roseateles sp. TaxID=1971397 RepID=UPI004035BE33
MRVTLRCLLIGLLILALPLKGLAAGGDMACGPAHSGAAMGEHHHAAGSASDHHNTLAAVTLALAHEVSEATPVDGAHSSTKTDVPPATKCMKCAPCCGAAMPHAESPTLAAEFNVDTVLHDVCYLAVGGRIDRIDRPPRSQL